jgi:CxxC motif-containing protein
VNRVNVERCNSKWKSSLCGDTKVIQVHFSNEMNQLHRAAPCKLDVVKKKYFQTSVHLVVEETFDRKLFQQINSMYDQL